MRNPWAQTRARVPVPQPAPSGVQAHRGHHGLAAPKFGPSLGRYRSESQAGLRRGRPFPFGPGAGIGGPEMAAALRADPVPDPASRPCRGRDPSCPSGRRSAGTARAEACRSCRDSSTPPPRCHSASAGATMRPIMVVGIILAAGASSRMGRPKALLPIGAGPLRHARLPDAARRRRRRPRRGGRARARGRSPTAARRRRSAARGSSRTRGATRGNSPRVLAGLAVADRPGVDAVLVHLVDAPLVSPGDRPRGRSTPSSARTLPSCARRSAVATAIRCCSRARSSTNCGAPIRRVGAKGVVRAHAADVCDVSSR